MDSKITRLIEQASVIVGALPYLQAYRDKTFLIKFGGSAMDDPRLVKKLMRDIVLLEALDHIVPYMKTVCESYASADLARQLPVLLGGMAVYALEVWLAYRKSAARFEKVDL